MYHGGDAQPSNIDWKYLQANIKEAVEYHIAVKELAMEAESCFSLMVFNQILTNVATTCVTWYEVQLVRYLQNGCFSTLIIWILG